VDAVRDPENLLDRRFIFEVAVVNVVPGSRARAASMRFWTAGKTDAGRRAGLSVQATRSAGASPKCSAT